MSTLEIEMRTVESNVAEVFVDINDLIIELMKMEQNMTSEAQKDVLRKIIKMLVERRNKGHKS